MIKRLGKAFAVLLLLLPVFAVCGLFMEKPMWSQADHKCVDRQ